jgi:hypothetical protein
VEAAGAVVAAASLLRAEVAVAAAGAIRAGRVVLAGIRLRLVLSSQ